MDNRNSGFQSWVNFYEFIGELIKGIYGNSKGAHESAGDQGVDYVVKIPNGTILVEVRSVFPMTLSRLNDLVLQMRELRQNWVNETGIIPKLAIALPGTLTADRKEFIERHEIKVWDSSWIFDVAERLGVLQEAEELLRDTPNTVSPDSPGRRLINELRETSPGKPGWASYQNLCGSILEYLFCPPLNKPISERSNLSKTNRRDFIMPNYCTDGVWGYLSRRYGAEYIVADAKNYSGEVEKAEILQLANYLSEHGAGLFGLIVTRNKGNSGAEQTVREQWIMHRKMICIIGDDDIVQMVTSKEHGLDPSTLIRQKIEDFRLSF